MKNIRFYISKYCLYTFIFCALFLLQRKIIISFFDVKRFIVFDKIYVYEIVLLVISFIEVKCCISIDKL